MSLRTPTLRAILKSLALVALAVCAVSIVRLSFNEGFFVAQDEGILLVYPDLILRGYVPYRDFAALYPPADFYIIAGLFRVFGESIHVERSLAAAYWCLLLVAAYLVGSRVNRLTGSLAAVAVLAYLSVSWSLGAHTHFGAYVCILFAMALAGRDFEGNASLTTHVLVLTGTIAGTTLCFKQDFGMVAIASTLVASNPFKPHRLLAFFRGVAIPVCALAIFAVFVGPAAVFDSLILDPMRAAPGRVLPLNPGWGFAVILACIAIQCFTVVRARSPRVPFQLVWLARGMATFSVGHFLVLLHRTSSDDILIDGFLIICFTVVSVPILLLQEGIDHQQRTVTTVAIFLASLIPVGILKLADRGADYPWHWVSSKGRTVPMIDPNASWSSDLQRLVDEINRLSRGGEKVFVGLSDLRFAWHNDTYIYYLFPQLQPASRYLEMNPGCANRADSGLSDQLLSADWLILTRRFDVWHEPNASMVPGPAVPNEVVRTHFCTRGHYGPWDLLQRCDSD